MHALCTIVARNIHEIERCMEYYQQDEAWDYAMVGGRYSNIVPVSKKCKTFHSGGGWPDLPGETFSYGDRLQANPDLKYTNVARIRNINHEERFRIKRAGGLDVFEPYTMILCHPDGGYEWLDLEQMDQAGLDRLSDWLIEPQRQSWFVAVVDYHY